MSDNLQTYNELITMLSDYCGENGTSESAVETLGRLLEELEHLRSCARRYIAAVENDEEPNLYLSFKSALGERVV